MLSIKNMIPTESPGPGRIGFPPEVKFNVVTNYLATGSLKIAAASVGVAYETVKKWHQQQWWKEYEFEIANAKKTETNNKLSKIVDKSLSLLEDRLDNGDYIINQKTGEIVRRPVQLRDLNQVMNNILLRQEAIEKEKKNQKQIQQQESVQDLLKSLAEEFSKFNGSRKKFDIVDVEDAQVKDEDDALHEGRETGLQEGEQTVQQQTSASEEQGGAKPSAFGIGEGGISPQGGW
ncbi:MAG TPA: hypothetical protein VFM18_23035 [Methanosarcina sp.]|nr:hypothetical protein [Methanosarcina sp.]